MTFGVHPRGPVPDAPGPFRHAALFDGVSSSVELRVETSFTYTISCWVKRLRNTTYESFWSNSHNSISRSETGPHVLLYSLADRFAPITYTFYDPSVFDHLVYSVDEGGGTLFLNGSSIGTIDSFPIYSTFRIGARYLGEAFFEGMISEFYIVDGLALSPDHFAMTDLHGRWKPKVYRGEAETYLRFADPLNLGKNSGMGDDWTVYGGLSYAADGPSINVATLNSLVAADGTTLSNVNRTQTHASATSYRPLSMYGQDGLYYGETTVDSATGTFLGFSGVVYRPHRSANFSFSDPIDGYLWTSDGTLWFDINSTDGYPTYGVGDRLMFALDLVEGHLFCGKNGDWLTPAGAVHDDLKDSANAWAIDLLDRAPAWTMAVGASTDETGVVTAHVAEGDLLYLPDGYKTFTAANLPAPVVPARERFNAVTYSGSGPVVGVGHQPSLLWLKSRSSTSGHYLFDVMRGKKNALHPHISEIEKYKLNNPDSFDIDGFTLNSNPDLSTASMIAWSWFAGPTVTSTLGGGTVQVAAAPEGHFSIVRYIGTGVAGTRVAHGLGGMPDLWIVKRLSAVDSWRVGSRWLAATEKLYLDLSHAKMATTSWHNTYPDAEAVTLGASTGVNATGEEYMMYSFRSVPGLCHAGLFVGNGISDGPFVNTGFRPRWLMIKILDPVSSWIVFDTARNSAHVYQYLLSPDLANAEFYSPSAVGANVLSNGFKVINSTSISINGAGKTYLYLAMADVPFSLA